MASGPERRFANRRAVLRAGIGALAAGALGSACGNSTSTEASGKAVRPPAYVPVTSGEPDLPADPDVGIPPGYFHYPKHPKPFIDGKVGNGGPVNALLQAHSIAVPKERNQRWQATNEALGIDLNINYVNSVDYQNKLQVTLAGGELPDLAQIVSIPELPGVLQSGFADLSEHLSGKRIRDYPALAAIPPIAWKTCTVNGRIWGVPQPRPAVGVICSTNGALLDDLGINPDVSSGQEFLDLCTELTDKRRGRWALGSDPVGWSLRFVLEMLGAPNGWSERNGRFRSALESEQMPEALEIVRKMWEAGVLHPDSFSAPASNESWWLAGTTVFYLQDFTGWTVYSKSNPELRIGVIAPPKWEGGGLARKHLGPGAYGAFTAFRKGEPERVEEMLRIANYIAAPFGSEEHLLMNYGVEGADYELDGTDPILTDNGTSEMLPLPYVSSTAFMTLYVPGAENLVRSQHDYVSEVLPDGVPNATLGLYSETDRSKGVSEREKLEALQADIVQGRQSVSKWKDAVADWRKRVGDQTRKELEESYAANA